MAIRHFIQSQKEKEKKKILQNVAEQI